MCQLEAIVAVGGEQVCPYLTFLPRLADLLGQTDRYVASWVREFYASLWIDLDHRFIHFTFRGCDCMLYSDRVREILRIPESATRIHQICYGQTQPLRHPHGGAEPPTNLVRAYF